MFVDISMYKSKECVKIGKGVFNFLALTIN